MHSPVVPPHLFERLHDLIRKARTFGADAADGVYVESQSVAASVRGGKLDDLERSESGALGLRVLIGRKQASLSTEDLNPAGFLDLAEKAVAMARLAPEDPFTGLADAAMLARNIPVLDLFDAVEPPAAALVETAREMEALVRSQKGITNVEDAAASWGISGFAFVTSHGFAGGYRSTAHGRSVKALAGEGTNMVRDYDYASAHHAADLRSGAEIAQVAAVRTLSRVGARKMPTCKVPVVFAPRVAGEVLRAFLSGINGQAVARQSSFLGDALGTDLFSAPVSIMDDPLMPRGLRSRPFDGEGLPVEKRALVEHGRLTTWLLNSSAARQLKLKSTGHASRGLDGVPGISASNVYMAPGRVTPDELIADIAAGFYVIETMGFGVNTLTGDYSQGAAGFWIEKGKIAFPVHEMTIAGNLKAMFKNLTAANDLTHRYGIDAPTLRIEGMTVAGN